MARKIGQGLSEVQEWGREFVVERERMLPHEKVFTFEIKGGVDIGFLSG